MRPNASTLAHGALARAGIVATTRGAGPSARPVAASARAARSPAAEAAPPPRVGPHPLPPSEAEPIEEMRTRVRRKRSNSAPLSPQPAVRSRCSARDTPMSEDILRIRTTRATERLLELEQRLANRRRLRPEAL